jgi:hypothetical protein
MYSFDSFADGNHLFVWCVENFCGDKKPLFAFSFTSTTINHVHWGWTEMEICWTQIDESDASVGGENGKIT